MSKEVFSKPKEYDHPSLRQDFDGTHVILFGWLAFDFEMTPIDELNDCSTFASAIHVNRFIKSENEGFHLDQEPFSILIISCVYKIFKALILTLSKVVSGKHVVM